jgi:Flp pilus assembly protein TadB
MRGTKKHRLASNPAKRCAILIEAIGGHMSGLEWVILLAVIGLVVWKVKQAKAEEDAELNSLAKLPSSVSQVVTQMNPQQQAEFFNEYQKNKKSLVIAYITWLIFAVYYFYFRKPGWNIALWIAFVAFGVGFIWWAVDFFRMPSIRREYNADVARQALQTLSLGSSFGHLPPEQ